MKFKLTKFIPFLDKNTKSYNYLISVDSRVLASTAVIGKDNIEEFNRISISEVRKLKDYFSDDFNPKLIVKIESWNEDGITIDYTDVADVELINVIEREYVVAKISTYINSKTNLPMLVNGFGIM